MHLTRFGIYKLKKQWKYLEGKFIKRNTKFILKTIHYMRRAWVFARHQSNTFAISMYLYFDKIVFAIVKFDIHENIMKMSMSMLYVDVVHFNLVASKDDDNKIKMINRCDWNCKVEKFVC